MAVYAGNYYWKVRKDVGRARSVLADNRERCGGSIVFWKFYMNFVYSVDEKPAEGLVTVLNELLAASLSHGDKVTLYELFLQYSATICTDLQDLLRLKADYAVWKLAARAEQEAKEEERGSVKREAPAPAPVMAPVQQGEVASYPAIPGTVPGTMPAMQTMPMMPAQVPTDPNSPEYAQYYYQYYQYYGYPQGAVPPVTQ